MAINRFSTNFTRMLRLISCCLLIFFSGVVARGQDGSMEGVLLDANTRLAVQGATVELTGPDGRVRLGLSDKTGFFSFDSLSNNFYRLRASFMGYGSLTMDSIHIYAQKKNIILGEIFLAPASTNMDAVIIYAEKPLVQSRDGNLTLNVGESPLAAGSNAAELLRDLPLVNTDPDGKVTVRGREPRILVDEKPVELNGQQLSDFLESFPGGMIEKIEVMTNPPPQFANEPGGVINIVTRRGKIGTTGRLTSFGGTRGELGGNASLNVRKRGFSLNFVGGLSGNEYRGGGSAVRENFYPDSSNMLQTANAYVNRPVRSFFRFKTEVDLDSRNNLTLQLGYNGNDYLNRGITNYRNVNGTGELYRISDRNIRTEGSSRNPSLNVSYTLKGRRAGEQLRFILNGNSSDQENDRYFLQEFFDGKYAPAGPDSIQSQLNNTRNLGYNTRIWYNRPFNDGRTTLSLGGSWNNFRSRIALNSYYQLPDGAMAFNDLLSNNLLFRQQYHVLRTAVKQQIVKGFTFTAGTVWQRTGVYFDVYSQQTKSSNGYVNILPFVNTNRSFENGFNISASYRKGIRRPGVNEMNPVIDYADPYNIRYGNPELVPSASHNFDLSAGRSESRYYYHLGLGYNIVDDIFAQVRTLIDEGKTIITWANISGRKEYEVSGWAGFSVERRLRFNFSLGYTFNEYSAYDIDVNRYRNGGSLNTKMNFTYTPGEYWNLTGNMNYSRWASPQGLSRGTTAMNFGVQRKFFQKKLLATFNVVDPVIQRRWDNTSAGTNFRFSGTGTTETRNFRLTLTYLFSMNSSEKQS